MMRSLTMCVILALMCPMCALGCAFFIWWTFEASASLGAIAYPLGLVPAAMVGAMSIYALTQIPFWAGWSD